jgi:hypothetical protein
VIRDAGYNGEYGVIRLFQKDELRRHTAGGLLFETAPSQSDPAKKRKGAPGKASAESAAAREVSQTDFSSPPTPPRHSRTLVGERKISLALSPVSISINAPRQLL